MAIQSKFYELLPEGYGYVLLVATSNAFVNFWMAGNVQRARKQYGIEAPKMYSDDNVKFNCIQRAHQNTLENHPTFLFFLLTGGLQYPYISAGAGVLYTIGRIMYAKGYYSEDPKNRKWGCVSHVAILTLLGNTISFATHQLGCFAGKACCRRC